MCSKSLVENTISVVFFHHYVIITNFLFEKYGYGPSHKCLGQTKNVIYFSFVKQFRFVSFLFLYDELEKEVILKNKQENM